MASSIKVTLEITSNKKQMNRTIQVISDQSRQPYKNQLK